MHSSRIIHPNQIFDNPTNYFDSILTKKDINIALYVSIELGTEFSENERNAIIIKFKILMPIQYTSHTDCIILD